MRDARRSPLHLLPDDGPDTHDAIRDLLRDLSVSTADGDVPQLAARLATMGAHIEREGLTGLLLEQTLRYALERDRALAELRERDRQHRLVFEAAEALLVVDDDGRYIDANPAALRLLDTTAEAVIGRRVGQAAQPHQGEDEVRPFWDRVMATGVGHELRTIRRGGGGEVTVHVTALGHYAPGRHLLALHHLTHLVADREAVRESERRLRGLLDGLGLYATILDRAGVTVYVNQALARRMGREADDLVGSDLFESGLFPRDGDAQRRSLMHAFEAETTPDAWENELEAADGSAVRVSWTSVFLRDDDGHITAIASLGEDVTARDVAAAERASLESQLRQAQRMDAIGQLAGGIAHDLNNLLTAIRGFNELAQTTHDPEDHGQVDRNAERASGLARQLLAFSRRQVLEPEALEPAALVADMAPMLARLLGADVRLHLVPGTTGHVIADRGQLEQVVLNLAVNARDAMPDGGDLSIEVSRQRVDVGHARRHGDLMPVGDYVVLTVSDTGIGMSPEVQARVFEPYFTTKTDAGRSYGLGLSVAYGIVKQSGGHIWLYSELGQGSTFKVYLPQAKDGPEAVVQTPVPEVRGGSESILIVEDEEPIRTFVARTLRGLGYAIAVAESPEDALDLGAGARFDLLLTDLIMPGTGGRDLARAFLERQPSIRIVYMSGYSAERVATNGRLEAGTRFLPKPFGVADLAAAVRTALDEPRLIG